MNLAEYQTLASRTCAPLDGIEMDLLHMRMGVISELGELADAFKRNIAYKKPLDFTNIREEIGDICWYLVNEMRFKGLTIDFDFEPSLYGKKLTIPQVATAVTVGLTEAYLVITNASNVQPYYEYLKALYDLCYHLGINFYVALELNIKKLEARYPDKFTEDAALIRDLKREREILENNELKEGDELFYSGQTGESA